MAYNLDRLNTAPIAKFGQQVTYEQEAAGLTTVLTGIVTIGDGLEASQPGIHAELFIKRSALSVAPAKYDRVTIGGKLYQVNAEPNINGDGGEGVSLLLRYLQDVPI
jgi:hypothetical protein